MFLLKVKSNKVISFTDGVFYSNNRWSLEHIGKRVFIVDSMTGNISTPTVIGEKVFFDNKSIPPFIREKVRIFVTGRVLNRSMAA